uniref:Uncharacterized protein n=1 Tax=Anguilla anguilla TaxID=7936 RepID=A0A0E9S0I4_ANGAN
MSQSQFNFSKCVDNSSISII